MKKRLTKANWWRLEAANFRNIKRLIMSNKIEKGVLFLDLCLMGLSLGARKDESGRTPRKGIDVIIQCTVVKDFSFYSDTEPELWPSKWVGNWPKMGMKSKFRQNLVKMQSKFSENSVKIQTKFRQNSVKIQTKLRQNSVKIQSKFSQNSVKIQSKFSQN